MISRIRLVKMEVENTTGFPADGALLKYIFASSSGRPIAYNGEIIQII